ncbi:MAG: L,D-transpeptidase/peptidoglycan binding protein [Lachnospiraceae bacterium]|nr:L,D-transpeptidase/peptidoglycan binding protein [Lachnospiraceae bacterium]
MSAGSEARVILPPPGNIDNRTDFQENSVRSFTRDRPEIRSGKAPRVINLLPENGETAVSSTHRIISLAKAGPVVGRVKVKGRMVRFEAKEKPEKVKEPAPAAKPEKPEATSGAKEKEKEKEKTPASTTGPEKKEETFTTGPAEKPAENEAAPAAEAEIIPFPEKKEKKPINYAYLKKCVMRVVVICAGLSLIAYLAGAVIFSQIFYPRTVLNGIGCGLLPASKTEELISETIAGYSIEIKGRDGMTGTISSEEIRLMPVFHGEVKETIKAQQPFRWPLLFRKLQEIDLEEVTLYSNESLREAVSKLPFFDPENIRKPEDAYIGDITDQGYVITKEDKGTVPIESGIVKTVASAVDTLDKTVSIDNDACYETAVVTSTDKELNTLLENLNQYCAAKIIYEFGDKEEILDANKINEWITVEGSEVTFDESQVAEYVKTLARRYDTFGQPHAFTTHEGEEITIVQGAYGWWMDRTKETEELIECIKSGYRGKRTPVYKETAAQYGTPDYGDNYVEVDLTNQHLWVYEGGKPVVDSDFVSGNVSKNNGTHVGIYGITYKERNATLSGANYASHVSYWMPFNGNEGMHDATWRSSFGGDIYLTSGSHGCVNLPLEKAAEIYDHVEEGEAVIVYGGKTYTPPAQPEPDPLVLDPMQQLQLLIDAGILNPDGSIPETTTVQE